MTKVDRVTDKETGHTLTLELHGDECRVGLKCESDECGEIVVLDEDCSDCARKAINSIQERFRKLDIDEMQDEVIHLLQHEPLDDKVTDAGWVNLTGSDLIGSAHHFLSDHPEEDDNEDGTEIVCDGTSLDEHFKDGDEWEVLPGWLQMLYEEIANKRIEDGGGVVCRF